MPKKLDLHDVQCEFCIPELISGINLVEKKVNIEKIFIFMEN